MGSLPPPAATIDSSISSSLLQPQAMPLISLSTLLGAHLSQSPPRRHSGRTPLQSRPISLNTSSLTHAHGSSIVKIGNGTTVVCGVRGEILPLSDIPSWSVKDAITRATEEWEAAEAADEETHTNDKESKRFLERNESKDNDDALWQHNLLVPNISLDTGCSPLHPANTAPSVEQQSISQRLLSLLLTSKLVRLRDLEIYRHYDTTTNPEPNADTDAMQLDDPTSTSINTKSRPSSGADGSDEQQPRTLKAFWTLYIDILCISHAGSASVFDAAWLALLAALRTTELPAAEWDVDLGRVVCFAPSSGESGSATGGDRRQPRRLRLRGNPVPLGWGVFGVDQRVAAAATAAGKDGGNGSKEESESEPAAKAATTAKTTMLIDLDSTEEEVCPEQGCVVVDRDSSGGGETTLLRLEKSGGAATGVQEIQLAVEAAEGRWREWEGLMGGLS